MRRCWSGFQFEPPNRFDASILPNTATQCYPCATAYLRLRARRHIPCPTTARMSWAGDDAAIIRAGSTGVSPTSTMQSAVGHGQRQSVASRKLLASDGQRRPENALIRHHCDIGEQVVRFKGPESCYRPGVQPQRWITLQLLTAPTRRSASYATGGDRNRLGSLQLPLRHYPDGRDAAVVVSGASTSAMKGERDEDKDCGRGRRPHQCEGHALRP